MMLLFHRLVCRLLLVALSNFAAEVIQSGRDPRAAELASVVMINVRRIGRGK